MSPSTTAGTHLRRSPLVRQCVRTGRPGSSGNEFRHYACGRVHLQNGRVVCPTVTDYARVAPDRSDGSVLGAHTLRELHGGSRADRCVPTSAAVARQNAQGARRWIIADRCRPRSPVQNVRLGDDQPVTAQTAAPSLVSPNPPIGRGRPTRRAESDLGWGDYSRERLERHHGPQSGRSDPRPGFVRIGGGAGRRVGPVAAAALSSGSGDEDDGAEVGEACGSGPPRPTLGRCSVEVSGGAGEPAGHGR